MTTTTFAGLPVQGDITKGSSRVAQRPEEELVPLLTALLNAEGVKALRWRQYTPYFNDGDVCEFGAHSPYVQLDTEPEVSEEEAEEYYDEEEDPRWVSTWDTEFKGGPQYETVRVEDPSRFAGYRYDRRETGVTMPTHPAYTPLKAFEDAIESGAFDHVLLDKFGDHAIVTVTRDGITVDYYEHD